MTVNEIKSLVHGPEPFTLKMVSGREHRVPYPDAVSVNPEGTAIALFRENGVIETVRISQIESYEVQRDVA